MFISLVSAILTHLVEIVQSQVKIKEKWKAIHRYIFLEGNKQR